MSGPKKTPLTPAEIDELEYLVNRRDSLPHLHGFPWYKWAWDFFNSTNQHSFLCAANQVSKDLDENELIPTVSGFKKMRDICIGDYVFSRNGKKTKVIDIPFVGDSNGYLLTFSDGSKVVCGENHDWICKGSKQRFRKKYSINSGPRSGQEFDNPSYGEWVVKPLNEIKRHYSPFASNYERHCVPICNSVEYPDSLLFEPYAIGFLIGNGCLTGRTAKVTINKLDTDISEYFVNKIGAKKIKCKKDIDYTLPLSIRNKIIEMGLNVTAIYKKIPRQYLESGYETRLAILRGLMDSDGTTSAKNAATSYSTISLELANNVCELVHSLGGIAQIKRRTAGYKKSGIYKRCNDAYIVSVWTNENPFLFKRKSSLWRSPERTKHERILSRIDPIGKIRSKCITVDSLDGSFLCTRNYIVTHNSSTQIRKVIDWATDQSKWKKLWPSLLPGQKPNQFWYFYPSAPVATVEFETKWVPDFLPRGEMKSDPVYGWKEEYDKNYIKQINFNSGVTIYFKTYSQKIIDLQSGSVHYIALDEETPEFLISEFQARLRAVKGYLSAVFTATIGQEFWRKVMEPHNKDEEIYPNAFKRTVSLYDSQEYIDGSKSRWTNERIAEVIAECTSEAEVQRRVFGRFVKSENLAFHAFSLDRNMMTPQPIPKSWSIYGGVDPGSGGKSGHPAAIIFIAVRPDYREGWIFRGWRGDGIPTANPDILDKFRELRGALLLTSQVYDYKDKDFQLVALSQGEPFEMANKSRDQGFGVVNSLYKNGMLKIFRGDVELDKLVGEVLSLPKDIDKRSAIDDLCDAKRYTCMAIPWDFSHIAAPVDLKKFADPPVDARTEESIRQAEILKARREFALNISSDIDDSMESEFEYWNELSGSGND